MIKKLLTAGILLSGIASVNAQAQFPERFAQGTGELFVQPAPTGVLQANKTTSVSVQDTLYYFLRKHMYRATTPNSFPIFLSPNTATITEMGSSFRNPGNNPVTVSGAVVFAGIKSGSPSSTLTLAVTIYSATPLGAPGASVATATCVTTASNSVGFSSIASFSPAVTLNSSYFIGYHCASANPLDTALVAMARGFVSTYSLTNDRFSDSLGYARQAGTFYTLNSTFGPSSWYEPIVVPFVSFSYTADATPSAPNSTVTPGTYCANTFITYTNTSAGGFYNNRQYNYNKFSAKWSTNGTYYNPTPAPPATDSVYNWSFAGPATPTAAYTSSNVSHAYGVAGNASSNLILKYQRHSGSKVQDVKTWTLQISNCGIVGIDENSSSYTNLNVYPNPLTNGKLNIAGLEGGVNTITVYNIMGQLVATKSVEAEATSVDLTSQPAGTYVIKVTDSLNRSKLVKVINQ